MQKYILNQKELNETTHKYPFKYKIRFRFFEWKEGRATRFHRIARWWYKPIMILGNKLKSILYAKGLSSHSRFIWWIRNNIILS